ncbi:MAG: DNA/RNA nuclease SfsA [bacterium]|jgi:sugar fermentation stimulation protein A|nr:DNA/RNA nuclease SfsA [candidate division KSB1 bacterium]MDH7560446.1 DNA/RNA nuclease SfsA [bacterium]
MQLPAPLFSGTLVRRYQRFLADVRLADGRLVTAHCPNSGSMRGCSAPGSLVLLSAANDRKRRCAFTWELLMVDGTSVGINPLRANPLVAEAWRGGLVPELSGYAELKPEVRFGPHTRFDFMLAGPDGRCFVEVKNVTLVEDGVAYFPDAVTTRGKRHLEELVGAVARGWRAVIFFVVQGGDARLLRPADHIDPAYAGALRQALAAGVECVAYRARVSESCIELERRISCSVEPRERSLPGG